jgi:hypothetical protein
LNNSFFLSPSNLSADIRSTSVLAHCVVSLRSSSIHSETVPAPASSARREILGSGRKTLLFPNIGFRAVTFLMSELLEISWMRFLGAGTTYFSVERVRNVREETREEKEEVFL